MKVVRLRLMQRKRRLRLTPIPKIRVKIGTTKDGYIHYTFGEYGQEAVPTQYDEHGVYIKGQPWYFWASGTCHRPDYKEQWNRDLRRQFWNSIRVNIDNIHPLDLA